MFACPCCITCRKRWPQNADFSTLCFILSTIEKWISCLSSGGAESMTKSMSLQNCSSFSSYLHSHTDPTKIIIVIKSYHVHRYHTNQELRHLFNLRSFQDKLHLGYASASFLENLLISEQFSSASGPRSRYLPSRHGVNDEGLRGSSFSPCLSSSRSLIVYMQAPATTAVVSSTHHHQIQIKTSVCSSELCTEENNRH